MTRSHSDSVKSGVSSPCRKIYVAVNTSSDMFSPGSVSLTLHHVSMSKVTARRSFPHHSSFAATRTPGQCRSIYRDYLSSSPFLWLDGHGKSTVLTIFHWFHRHRHHALRNTCTNIERPVRLHVQRQPRRHRYDQLSLLDYPVSNGLECRHRLPRVIQGSSKRSSYTAADVSQPGCIRKRRKFDERPRLRPGRRRSRRRNAKVGVGPIYVTLTGFLPHESGRVCFFLRSAPLKVLPLSLASNPIQSPISPASIQCCVVTSSPIVASPPFSPFFSHFGGCQTLLQCSVPFHFAPYVPDLFCTRTNAASSVRVRPRALP